MRRTWKYTTAGLALGALALTGCGTAKTATLQADNAAARQHLAAARAVSLTLRFDDAKGELKNAMMTKGVKEDRLTRQQAEAILGGSITVSMSSATSAPLFDPAGQAGTSFAKRLEQANVEVVVRTKAGVLGDLRLVKGVLYARTDWKAIRDVAEVSDPGGAERMDAAVSGALSNPGVAVYATLIKDVQAGKWVKVPVSQYADRLLDAAEKGSGRPIPTPGPAELKQVLEALRTAVTPHVTLTDLARTGKVRKVNVDVRFKQALTAALKAFNANKKLFGLPASTDLFSAADLKDLADTTVRGVVTIDDRHYTKLEVKAGQLLALDAHPDPADPKSADLGSSELVLDLSDAAAPVTAPAPSTVSSFDVGQIVDMFLNAFAVDPQQFMDGTSS